MERVWPELDFRREYRELLANPSTLAAAAKNRVDCPTLVSLAQSLPRAVNTFEVEDLGALGYLDRLLNERPTARFEHVVVDEAQEVSLLELAIIREHSRNDSFTILGDLTQNLNPKGIPSWGHVRRLFRSTPITQYNVRSSLRSTTELTRYANSVLKNLVPTAVGAVPIARHGDAPKFVRSSSRSEMMSALVAGVAELRFKGACTIGILCKTAAEAKQVHQSLRERRLDQATLLDSSGGAQGEVSVARIYLARGLEYDAVLLANVHADSYPSTDLHNRLLYLGVTRAAHHLEIHGFGTLADALRQAAGNVGRVAGVARRTSRKEPR